ncbi:hypothetical protein JCM1840_004924 [Sporobolomyces johnsonii]
MSSSNPVLSTTLALVALQLGSRLFSFALNQLLLRSTNPQAFGVATIQLDTLRDTVLFLLREGVRGAVVRTRSNDSTTSPLKQQALLLPVLLAPAVPLVFFLFNALTRSASSSQPAHYTPTLALYTLSALLELLSEPYYLRTLQSWERLTSTRVRIEGAAVVAKAFATLVALKLGGEDDALLAYGWGQVAYAMTLLVGLWGAVGRRDVTERDTGWGLHRVEGRYFDPEVTRIGWALTKQSVVKQVLTEGDKLAVARYAKGEDMGGYAVALNYGSLVARILFQPLEESSRLYFSSLSSSAPSASPSSSANPTPAALLSCASHLRLLLTFYTHLTLVLLLLAPAFTTPLLHALLGSRWSATSAAAILQSYVLSLPFLAFNGLTEAFFQSVADPRSLRRGSVWMGVCTAAFAGTVWATMGRAGTGARGLVGANCVNMAMRTAFSTWFMERWFERETGRIGVEEQEEVRRQLRWRSWMPSVTVVVAFAAAGWACRWSEGRWKSTMLMEGGGWRPLLEHLGVGATVGVGCLAVVRLRPQRRTSRRSPFRYLEKASTTLLQAETHTRQQGQEQRPTGERPPDSNYAGHEFVVFGAGAIGLLVEGSRTDHAAAVHPVFKEIRYLVEHVESDVLAEPVEFVRQLRPAFQHHAPPESDRATANIVKLALHLVRLRYPHLSDHHSNETIHSVELPRDPLRPTPGEYPVQYVVEASPGPERPVPTQKIPVRHLGPRTGEPTRMDVLIAQGPYLLLDAVYTFFKRSSTERPRATLVLPVLFNIHCLVRLAVHTHLVPSLDNHGFSTAVEHLGMRRNHYYDAARWIAQGALTSTRQRTDELTEWICSQFRGAALDVAERALMPEFLFDERRVRASVEESFARTRELMQEVVSRGRVADPVASTERSLDKRSSVYFPASRRSP